VDSIHTANASRIKYDLSLRVALGGACVTNADAAIGEQRVPRVAVSLGMNCHHLKPKPL
jgi:hypothetical protein